MKFNSLSKPVLAVILILFIAVSIAFAIYHDRPQQTSTGAPITVSSSMTACSKNSDCTLVGFCHSFKGINYKYQVSWYKANPNIYGKCSGANTTSYVPECVSGQCVAKAIN